MTTSEGADRAALIARNEAVWKALAETFAGVEATEADHAANGAWSAKDHLVHVVVWERHRLAVLRGEDVAAAMGFTAAEWAAADEDGLNARIAERTKDLPIAAVLTEMETTRRALGEALAAVPDERLTTPYRTLHPEDGERGDGPVGEWAIRLFTSHASAHLGPIRARLTEALGKPPHGVVYLSEVPATVARLLDQLDRITNGLAASIREAGGARMVRSGGRSLADDAWDLAVRNRELAALLRGDRPWNAFGVDGDTWLDLRFQDRPESASEVRSEGQRLSPEERLGALWESRAAVRDAVASFEDDDLLVAYSAFQPDEPFYADPIINWIEDVGDIETFEADALIFFVDTYVGNHWRRPDEGSSE